MRLTCVAGNRIVCGWERGRGKDGDPAARQRLRSGLRSLGLDLGLDFGTQQQQEEITS